MNLPHHFLSSVSHEIESFSKAPNSESKFALEFLNKEMMIIETIKEGKINFI